MYKSDGGLGGVLVEVTWAPEAGMRLSLFADVEPGVTAVEARAVAVALLRGAQLLGE